MWAFIVLNLHQITDSKEQVNINKVKISKVQSQPVHTREDADVMRGQLELKFCPGRFGQRMIKKGAV